MKTQRKAWKNHSHGAVALAVGSCLLSGAAWAAPLVNTEGLMIGDGVSIDNNENSAAFGSATTASGENSAAFGFGTTASGKNSVAFGGMTTASDESSAALGSYTTASGYASVAFGDHTTASNLASTAFGFLTTASGQVSTAFGVNTTAQSFSSLVMGRYNVISGSTTGWVGTDPLFVIGNGSSSSNRRNAVTVLKNGKVGIGTASPEVELDVYGSVAFGSADNHTVQLGNAGTSFAAMRLGKYDVGSSSSNEKVVTVYYGETFGAVPVVIATTAGQPGKSYNNAFAVTVRSITTERFKAVIKRLDNTGGWGQALDLYWRAYEL
uniref:H-type lectin domain-containing protein n=1 Tax=Candidatus Kentrum sp. UNK TaxID=2126344 RepID=A0A451AL98_9GAMM|nr:MAG: H-type lectin domain-containing protein [Candidatus Kentron sp. UNK]VFK72227.1 MAG: H-type lectin domain-containing protein [Candidatus Kentron sp. UNK]